uniref:uncharacterized protein C1orf127 homolog n=1 Tax=Jaculus jaculus TaxID=51337 RepID=UPI001E1B5B3B|nr:uncharacterized protein C1orf127 homolog [Jaculus jaculus]
MRADQAAELDWALPLGWAPHMSFFPPYRTICLACVQPVVFSWILPFRSNRDRPHPGLGALTEITSRPTEKVECFSDYMTLKIPKSHVQGLRQWLAAILPLPGTLRAPGHLDALLDECGYLLHRVPEGDFVFRALYSACFVQKEKANYRLEIRIFRKGAKRLEQSDGYIMKCPVVMSRLVQQSVHCGPTVMQVSRPLPPRNDGGQTPWLLSFRGELVASLEDASLMGLDVDVNATTITIRHPRQDLLQRQEVRNTSLELLPLWLVSGYHAYSFEATCPPASAQPESEVFIHIPRQRLGLVKRGSHIEEILSLRFLRVHQSNIFTVTKDRDFVVIGIPAAGLLQFQPCQGAEGASGTQAFYRVDVSLGFAEAVAPVRWMVENVFQCVGSEEEAPASTATSRTALSSPSSGPEAPLAEMPFPASPGFQNAQLTAGGEPPRDFVPAEGKDKQGLEPSLKTSRPERATWAVSTFLSPKVMHDQRGPQDLPEKAGLSTPRQTSAALLPEPMGAARGGPGPSQPVSLTPTALIKQQFSEVPSPPLPAWRFDVSRILLSPELPVTPSEGLGAPRDGEDSAQTLGSTLLLGGLSAGGVVTAAPTLGQPAQVSEEFQPLMGAWVSSVTEEGMSSPQAPGMLQETSSTETAEGPQQNDGGPFEEGIRGSRKPHLLERQMGPQK